MTRLPTVVLLLLSTACQTPSAEEVQQARIGARPRADIAIANAELAIRDKLVRPDEATIRLVGPTTKSWYRKPTFTDRIRFAWMMPFEVDAVGRFLTLPSDNEVFVFFRGDDVCAMRWTEDVPWWWIFGQDNTHLYDEPDADGFTYEEALGGEDGER